MLLSTLRRAALVLLMSTLAWPALAATTLDFGGDPNALGLALGRIASPAAVSQDGIALSIRGFDGAMEEALNRNRGFGLGVDGAPNGGSLGRGEAIEFSFLGDVLAIDALVLEGGGTGALDVLVDGVLRKTITWSSNGTRLEDLGGLRGSAFRFVGQRGGVRIAKLTVEKPVPEPSAALVFVAGLLVASRRMRRGRRR
ncbi:MAG: hypothetical protein AAF430_07040 [Myxococcota bacterium]